MLVIKVELHSAITGDVTQLAIMKLCNDGTGTSTRGNYVGTTFRGKNVSVYDLLRRPLRQGFVRDYPRQSKHVWHLVARMLIAMGYR